MNVDVTVNILMDVLHKVSVLYILMQRCFSERQSTCVSE